MIAKLLVSWGVKKPTEADRSIDQLMGLLLVIVKKLFSVANLGQLQKKQINEKSW